MTEEKIKETVDTNKIEGEIGDVVIENNELFVIEEVSEKKDAKLNKDDGTVLEDVSKKDTKSEEVSSDEDFKVTDSMRVKMLEKKMKKMDRELSEASLTPEQVRKRVPLPDLQADIERQRTILSEIDRELNPDEWTSQNRIVTTLDGDITDKERSVELDRRYKSRDNTDFLKNERKLLSGKGFDFSDEQFDGIAAAAEEYLTDGMFTSEAIQKGLTDIIGADAVSKLYETGAEQKIREDLKTTVSKVTKSTRVTRTGIRARLSPYMDRLLTITEPDELETALDELNPEQYAIYKQKLARKNK